MLKTAPFIAALCVVYFILPFLLQDAGYEPHRDEYLYFAQGKHPAWGYLENPPLLAWLTAFFPPSFFSIKVWPALFGSLTFLVAANMVTALGGRLFAISLLFLAFVFGAYLRTFFLYQPNAPEVFFCALASLALVRYTQTSGSKWIYLLGLALALGMLSKYSVAFFVIALFVALLLTPYRKIFLSRHFFIASLLALVILFPNIWWQYRHNFPFFHHMHELQATQLQYLRWQDFVLNQLLMFFPAVFLWIAGLLYPFFVRNGHRLMVFSILYVVFTGLLLFFDGKGYYAMGIYPALFAFGAVACERAAVHRPFLRYLLPVVVLLTGLPFVPVLLPVTKPAGLAKYYKRIGVDKLGLLRWEDHHNHLLPQDFADMLGREQIAAETASAWNSLSNEEKKKTILFASNYGQAGSLNYYRKPHSYPKAMSTNGSFLLWLPETGFNHLILVTDDPREELAPLFSLAGSFEIVFTVTNPYSRELGTDIYIVKNVGERLKQVLKQEIDNKISRFEP